MKKCVGCKKIKNLEDFYTSKTSKDGRQCKCKICHREQLDQITEANFISSFKKENQIHSRNILGEVIRVSRKRLGMSQLELAKLAKIGVLRLLKFETGQSSSIDTFYKCLEVLNPELTINISHIDKSKKDYKIVYKK